MEETSQFSVGPNSTEPNLIHHRETTYCTGFDGCLNMLLSCFRKMMSDLLDPPCVNFRMKVLTRVFLLPDRDDRRRPRHQMCSVHVGRDGVQR